MYLDLYPKNMIQCHCILYIPTSTLEVPDCAKVKEKYAVAGPTDRSLLGVQRAGALIITTY